MKDSANKGHPPNRGHFPGSLMLNALKYYSIVPPKRTTSLKETVTGPKSVLYSPLYVSTLYLLQVHGLYYLIQTLHHTAHSLGELQDKTHLKVHILTLVNIIPLLSSSQSGPCWLLRPHVLPFSSSSNLRSSCELRSQHKYEPLPRYLGLVLYAPWPSELFHPSHSAWLLSPFVWWRTEAQ